MAIGDNLPADNSLSGDAITTAEFKEAIAGLRDEVETIVQALTTSLGLSVPGLRLNDGDIKDVRKLDFSTPGGTFSINASSDDVTITNAAGTVSISAQGEISIEIDGVKAIRINPDLSVDFAGEARFEQGTLA